MIHLFIRIIHKCTLIRLWNYPIKQQQTGKMSEVWALTINPNVTANQKPWGI